jgi:hypothetical protein
MTGRDSWDSWDRQPALAALAGAASAMRSFPMQRGIAGARKRLRIESMRDPCFFSILALLFATASPLTCAQKHPDPPLPGFVVHFDFIRNASEGLALVDIAQRAGAKVINLVPPAHVWEDAASLAALDRILADIGRRRLRLLITRVDASRLPDRSGHRYNYLYGQILTEVGRLPNGKETPELFLTTAGQAGYAEWMEEETAFYARHCGQFRNLLGINLGPFSEPDSAQRCGFLEYMPETRSYEITQYTPAGEGVWHRWLTGHFKEVAALNREYAAHLSSFDSVPLPWNETDGRFGRADVAYFDFVRSLNDWFVERYQRCRSIWHDVSGRNDIPFILQFNGGAAEKIVVGRAAFAAFDLPGWVDMADAIGLSLYTNSGFPDMGHASIMATLRLVAVSGSLGKDLFVLEGGNEAPNVTLDPEQLAFFGEVARPVAPRTYIYEFLKDKFDEEYPSNPGKVVAADGRIRRPAFNALRELFRRIESSVSIPEKPELYVISDSMASRGNSRAGKLNAALYDLAASIPICWIPKGREAIMRPSIPVLRMDGSISPSNEALTGLLASIPRISTPERAEWLRSVLKALGH